MVLSEKSLPGLCKVGPEIRLHVLRDLFRSKSLEQFEERYFEKRWLQFLE